jgi:hypothetical protein
MRFRLSSAGRGVDGRAVSGRAGAGGTLRAGAGRGSAGGPAAVSRGRTRLVGGGACTGAEALSSAWGGGGAGEGLDWLRRSGVGAVCGAAAGGGLGNWARTSLAVSATAGGEEPAERQ